jgi:deazaflavin-dependent oxidoreductase (nitroreductase family)
VTDRGPTEGFPDVRWGRSGTAAARAGERFVASRVGAACTRAVVPLDRWVLRRSHGRRTVLGPFGAPLLLLTTTGSVSGQPRTTPLVYLLDGSSALVVGSNFGQAHHPAWSTNLLARPDATVAIGGTDYPVRAVLLSGSERATAWAAFEAAAAPYRAYVDRTEREIRVFRLTRTDVA